MFYEYQQYAEAADFIRQQIDYIPEVGLILGSGLGSLADRIENSVVIPYSKIPNFLTSTVSTHAGMLILGELAGKKVVCMSGRFHYYEGYTMEQLAIPVRVLKLLGIKRLILTNAAGGVDPDLHPGDIVLIRDHIKLFGASPLRGPNIDEFGPRYADVSDMYTASLRKKALELGRDSGLTIREGIYYFTGGPQFETPAEIRAMRILGADMIGMSSVTEAITAAHCGLPLLGISVISNMAAGLQDKLSIEEVLDTAAAIEKPFCEYIEKLVRWL